MPEQTTSPETMRGFDTGFWDSLKSGNRQQWLNDYVALVDAVRKAMGTEFLKFLQQAVSLPKIPHFVCFDEMNLARIEYYFAPFLSAMETGGAIAIHSHEETIDAVEPSLPWPKNLYIIGTVNMDETTLAFSDKVLDRAFTLEFWEVDLDEFQKKFSSARATYPADLLTEVTQLPREIQAALAPLNRSRSRASRSTCDRT